MPHHELKQLPDGKIEVKLETGETFTGDPLEVTAKLADSKVETRRHYEAKEQELLNRQPDPKVNPDPEPVTQESQWQAYILDQTAKGLGYANAEAYKADLAAVKTSTAEMANRMVAGEFMASHPEFPNTPEANDAVTKLIQKNNMPFTADTLAMAHAKLVQDGIYKPLTEDEITQSWSGRLQAENRKLPPPMINSGNPEGQAQQPDPWSMPLDQLRKAALTAQKG